MIFTQKGGTGYGSSYSGTFENLSWYDGSPFEWRRFIYPIVKETIDIDNIQQRRLEITWYFYVFFKGNEVYQFHSYYEYYISQLDIMPSADQLHDIVLKSHEYLMKSFEGRRKEHNLLPPITPLSSEAIEQSLAHLRPVFPDLQKS